jgi:predicted LPLAT superfamily acyltransferase
MRHSDSEARSVSEPVGDDRSQMAAPPWSSRPERGRACMIRLGTRLALLLGRGAMRLLLLPICAYFLCFSPAERAASRTFLRKALGREPALADLFRHFHAFAATILDRVYLASGQYGRFDIRVSGEDIVAGMRARGEGGLLVGAHLGSFEIVRFLAREGRGMRVSLVMYEDNARNLNAALDAIDAERSMPVIALGRIDSMLKVDEALARGEFAGLLADRNLQGEGTVSRSFLGEPARFPLGPFRLAAMLRRPLVLMIGLYRGGNRYDVHFELIADMRGAERSRREEAMRDALDRYVSRLEHHCRLAPYNWFNFYDYWA